MRASVSWNRCPTRRYLFAAMACIYIGWALWSRSWEPLVLGLIWAAVSFTAWVDLTPRIDATGVHRPGRVGRQRRLPWSAFSGVRSPAPAEQFVVLELVDGRPLVLDGFPSDQSAAVAGVGGLPLLPRPAGSVARPVRPATPEEADRDVARRAADLAAQAAALDAQLHRRARA